MRFDTQPELSSGPVALVPLAPDHALDLLEAGRPPEIWPWMARGPFADQADVEGWIQQALELRDAGRQLPFAVVVEGKAVGSTRLMEVHTDPSDVEIGWTWLSPTVWRTGVNTHCKLALLSYLFEELEAPRVVLKTHLSHLRSQTAIERIGGGERHVVAPDEVMKRDSAYYFIPAARWPEVRARLEGLLAR
jgi:RimJ/RimL family protein N-acetyltransferase